MNNIFFDLDYTSFQQTLIKIVVFILASILLMWVIYFVLSKILFRKNKQRKEINLRLVFLWSLLTYFILFNSYLFILFYHEGIDSFNFGDSTFYLGILPQLTIYFALILIFFLNRSSIKKMININTIN